MRPTGPPYDQLLIRDPTDLDPARIYEWVARIEQFLDFSQGDYYLLIYEQASEINLRSLNQNNLYWEWMTQLSKHFTGKQWRDESGGVHVMRMTKDDAHDLMRHNFLGYENKTIGRTDLKPMLVSTSKLRKAEMSEYMHKIDGWAQDHGIFLTYPQGGDYAKYKEAAQ